MSQDVTGTVDEWVTVDGWVTAEGWVTAVATELATDDVEYAYSVMRAWLHLLRDRLTPETAAEFAASLPHAIRRVFYTGWTPSARPTKSDPAGYAIRFARAAGIPVQDITRPVRAVTTVLVRGLPAGAVQNAIDELSPGLRMLLGGEALRIAG